MNVCVCVELNLFWQRASTTKQQLHHIHSLLCHTYPIQKYAKTTNTHTQPCAHTHMCVCVRVKSSGHIDCCNAHIVKYVPVHRFSAIEIKTNLQYQKAHMYAVSFYCPTHSVLVLYLPDWKVRILRGRCLQHTHTHAAIIHSGWMDGMTVVAVVVVVIVQILKCIKLQVCFVNVVVL